MKNCSFQGELHARHSACQKKIDKFLCEKDALLAAEVFLRKNQTDKALDVLEAAAMQFPKSAVTILSTAWDILSAQEDQGRYNIYQKRIFDFPVKPGDKVLDMGSGYDPFPLATHLADITLTDDGYGRGGVPFKKSVRGVEKPVFECSAEKTPFADKEFDFVYCSHVLEHVENPAAACEELMRIGKKGYIETPTKGKDAFFCFAKVSNHINYLDFNNGMLIFNRYEEWEREGLGYNIFRHIAAHPKTGREKAAAALTLLRPQFINVMFLWEDEFLYQVNF